ncbi:hypothetical protein GCM10009599_25120 [Luteococcus peritonei]
MLAAVTTLALAGCAGVPTSGPVEQVSPGTQTRVEGGVQVRAVPPQPDGSPDVVMAGFIDAMASQDPDYAVARQYLTPRAAQEWNPAAGVTVFDGDTRSNLPGSTTAGLQARVVGRLDAEGHYSAQGGSQLRHNFTMQQVDGQWRISNPPQGLLVSQYTLRNRFTPADVWFLGANGSSVVPERVWLAANPITPTQAVQALLRGPSDWLAPAVSTAIPTGAKLTLPAVTVTDGVAEVPLDGSLAGLSDARRTQLAVQLAWTLRHFGDITALRILANGEPWAVPGQSATGEVAVANLPDLSPVATSAGQQPFAVQDGLVGRLDEQGTFSALGGAFGSPSASERAAEVSASSSSGTVAVVDRQRRRLVSATIGRNDAEVRLSAAGISRPHMTPRGQLWAMVPGDASQALWQAGRTGPAHRVAVQELRGTTLLGFSISPDESSMAVVLRRGSATELGLLRLREGRLDGYRPLLLQVNQQKLSSIADVGWVGPGQLMVLASPQPSERATAHLVSADGALIEAVGPAGDQVLAGLATQPRLEGTSAMLLTASGELLRFETAWRWSSLPGRVQAVDFPS